MPQNQCHFKNGHEGLPRCSLREPPFQVMDVADRRKQ
jgi:hypothetical protein